MLRFYSILFYSILLYNTQGWVGLPDYTILYIIFYSFHILSKEYIKNESVNFSNDDVKIVFVNYLSVWYII